MDEYIEDLEGYDQRYPVVVDFRYKHLPAYLQAVSKPYADLALTACRIAPSYNHNVAKALDHLLYAKDAAVRAMVQVLGK